MHGLRGRKENTTWAAHAAKRACAVRDCDCEKRRFSAQDGIDQYILICTNI